MDKDHEALDVDFNVEHGKGDDLFHGSSRVRAIMEGGLSGYVANMNRMLSMAVSNDDERQKLAQKAERESIEYQEKLKGGD